MLPLGRTKRSETVPFPMGFAANPFKRLVSVAQVQQNAVQRIIHHEVTAPSKPASPLEALQPIYQNRFSST